MKIYDIYSEKKQPVSLEIFPPKGELSTENARSILSGLCPLAPDFISVTYHSGASLTPEKTIAICSMIKNEFLIESMAHITCISSTRTAVKQTLGALKQNGIENVLALRGDIPADAVCGEYNYASELISELSGSGLSIGAACYPEIHPECDSAEENLRYMKLKEDAGAGFFISQLFFDNKLFFDFIDKVRRAGIKAPVSAGIMPILSRTQISRMIFTCAASLPAAIIRILNKYENSPDDLSKAGIEYACGQMRGILDSTDCGVHIYTMNRPDIASGILGGRK